MESSNLVKLGETNLTLADPVEDIRGRTVLDANRNEIGEVDGLLIDQDEGKVRFLEIGAGGFLGVGEKKFLMPVDAITRIDDEHVHIDKSREHVAAAPEYDPELASRADYYDTVYGYWGYAPYWAPGYIYPAYPYYPYP